jgi:dihydroorotase
VHEKEVDFVEAPPGILGLETAFSVTLELIRDEVLSPLELVRRFSTNPARLLGLEVGSLREGTTADIVVLSPERRWTYDPAKGYSKSRNSPWAGTVFAGRVEATLVGGHLAYHADRGVLVD